MFQIVAEGDVVILKTISPPPMQRLDEIVAKARRQAEEAGMTESDVDRAVHESRKDSRR